MSGQGDNTLSIMVYQRGRAQVRRYRLSLQFESESPVDPGDLAARLDRDSPDLLVVSQEDCDRLFGGDGQPLAMIPALAPSNNQADLVSGLCLVLPPGQDAVDPRWLLRRLSGALLLSPATGLLGTWALRREVERRLRDRAPFTFLYVDVDNFKAFNDYYGFERGDRALHLLAQLCDTTVRAVGAPGDLAAQIGGDDFALVCSVETAPLVGQRLVAEFDKAVPALYDPQDAEKGCITVRDRRGTLLDYPLLSLSVAAVSTAGRPVSGYAEIAAIAAELKCYAKSLDGSAYVEDRRRGESSPTSQS